MKVPRWITRGECLALHDMLLSGYGGGTGLRDDNVLASALAKPLHAHAYGQPTLPELAASYAAGIIRNHPFVDGNKRTGFMLAAVFLELNGYDFTAAEADVVLRTLALAAGEMSEAAYAAWLTAHAQVQKAAPARD